VLDRQVEQWGGVRTAEPRRSQDAAQLFCDFVRLLRLRTEGVEARGEKAQYLAPDRDRREELGCGLHPSLLGY